MARKAALLEQQRIHGRDEELPRCEYFLYDNLLRRARGETPRTLQEYWTHKNHALDNALALGQGQPPITAAATHDPQRGGELDASTELQQERQSQAAPKPSGQQTKPTQTNSREQFFNEKLAEAQSHLDEMRRRLEALGVRLDAAKIDEEVDVDADVDEIEDLIWRYNDELESARAAWLRDDLFAAANGRLLEMLTPLSFGLPMFTDDQQAERHKRQLARISERLHSRDVIMDRLVFGARGTEIAGNLAGVATGGLLIKATIKGGRWAVVKTVAVTVAAIAAEQGVEKGMRAAGASEETIRGAVLAAAVVAFILLRRRSQVGSTEPQPSAVPASPPRPGTGLVPKAPVELGKWGEVRLKQVLGGRGFKPKSPLETSLGKRYVDRIVDRVAHEAKAGVNVGLTSQVRTQALKDAELVASGTIKSAHWHFFQGAQHELLDFLTSLGIEYTVH